MTPDQERKLAAELLSKALHALQGVDVTHLDPAGRIAYAAAVSNVVGALALDHAPAYYGDMVDNASGQFRELLRIADILDPSIPNR